MFIVSVTVWTYFLDHENGAMLSGNLTTILVWPSGREVPRRWRTSHGAALYLGVSVGASRAWPASCPLPSPILEPRTWPTAGGCSVFIYGMNEGKNHFKIRWFKPPFRFPWAGLALYTLLSIVVSTFSPTLNMHYICKRQIRDLMSNRNKKCTDHLPTAYSLPGPDPDGNLGRCRTWGGVGWGWAAATRTSPRTRYNCISGAALTESRNSRWRREGANARSGLGSRAWAAGSAPTPPR